MDLRVVIETGVPACAESGNREEALGTCHSSSSPIPQATATLLHHLSPLSYPLQHKAHPKRALAVRQGTPTRDSTNDNSGSAKVSPTASGVALMGCYETFTSPSYRPDKLIIGSSSSQVGWVTDTNEAVQRAREDFMANGESCQTLKEKLQKANVAIATWQRKYEKKTKVSNAATCGDSFITITSSACCSCLVK